VTTGVFDYVRSLVREHSALVLEPGQEYLVESRLDPLARHEGFASFDQLVGTLRGNPFGDLHRRVVEAMTNNETTFFRDARVFGMLRRSIIPMLLSARSAERSLNIWCAACSSGQEPYSLAMLLQEHRPALDGWDVRIIATDISRPMLERAQAGRYSQLEVNRGLPAQFLVKHGSVWEIRPDIRRMVQFRELNLVRPWVDLPGPHLVLMRNVLIYFDVETKKGILGRAGRLLDPAGYLVLGSAETTMNLDESMESVSFDGAVCFRKAVVRSPSSVVRRCS
jgi:chemotaxis protein methyltransferase CheR